jgi:hypothetical protein
MSIQFSPECLEQLAHYIYALEDPRVQSADIKRIFYVGKGIGNRCFAHAADELKAIDISQDQLKLRTIREIRAVALQPKVRVVAHGLKADEALRIESVLISLLEPFGNLVRGHGHEDYWVDASELDARYRRPLHQDELRATILLVSLNGGKNLPPYPEIENNPDELATRTLGIWTVRKNADRVDYVVGVYRGLTPCVYKVDKTPKGSAIFEDAPPEKLGGRRRVRFQGSLNRDHPQWLLRSIVDSEGNTMTKLPQQSWRLLAGRQQQ